MSRTPSLAMARCVVCVYIYVYMLRKHVISAECGISQHAASGSGKGGVNIRSERLQVQSPIHSDFCLIFFL